MTTIYKYPFQTQRSFSIELPAGAEVLCVQVQNETSCIWAKVETGFPLEKANFEVYGTGHEIPVDYKGRYRGTYQLDSGSLVFHLFQVYSK